MVFLRVPVQCFRCGIPADRSQVLESKSMSGDIRFECYDCYKSKHLSPGSETNKRSHYCEKFMYKFTSRNNICPYCSKNDHVITGSVTVEDLLY